MRHGARLLLLRHAKSDAPYGPISDAQRPLSAKGRKGADLVADYLITAGFDPDLVLCSSALRTRQTVEQIARALPASIPVLIEDRLYLAEPNDLLARLREIDEGVPTVLMVGHNPGIQALAVGLLAPAERHRIPTFPASALAVLDLTVPRWAELGAATARLVDYVTPRSLSDRGNLTDRGGSGSG